MRLDFKMPSDLGFFPLTSESPGSRLCVAIGIKRHCEKLVVSFKSGRLGIPHPPILSLFNSYCKCPTELILHMVHYLVDRTLQGL